MNKHWNVWVSAVLVMSAVATMPTAMAVSQSNRLSDIQSEAIAPLESLTLSEQSSAIASDKTDEDAIRQLTQQWFKLWSPGKAAIDWDAMGKLFTQTPGELLVFDDADSNVVVLKNWVDYPATWKPFMEKFTEWRIEPEGEIRVIVEGDLATTMFTLTGGGVDRKGNAINFRQRGTHVWQRRNDRWVIVHEHLTTDS